MLIESETINGKTQCAVCVCVCVRVCVSVMGMFMQHYYQ